MAVSNQSNSAANSNGASEKTYGWCSVCNVSVEGDKSPEHFESRIHLNRCLQKGFGISLVPGSGVKEGDRSSSWCSVCNHTLESVSAAQEHYESRSHLNKCLQRGVGIPLTHPGAMPMMPPPPLVPRSQGCSAGLGSLQTGAGNLRPGMSVQNIRPRISFNYPAADKRPRILTDPGGKNFPIKKYIHGAEQQSSSAAPPHITVVYGMGNSCSSGYGQELRTPDAYSQYDGSWQSPTMATKNAWPYCDQTFQPVSIISQHCNSSAHADVKMMKQGQYATESGYQSQAAGGSNAYRGGGGAIQTQAFPFAHLTTPANVHDQPRNGGGGHIHYGNKDWRQIHRSGQFFS